MEITEDILNQIRAESRPCETADTMHPEDHIKACKCKGSLEIKMTNYEVVISGQIGTTRPRLVEQVLEELVRKVADNVEVLVTPMSPDE